MGVAQPLELLYIFYGTVVGDTFLDIVCVMLPSISFCVCLSDQVTLA
jgi:hypothetical protein